VEQPCATLSTPRGAEETLISSILPSLHARGAALAVEQIVPLRTDEYPTPAQLPRNSRIDLTRLHQVFGLRSPTWQAALAPELDQWTLAPAPYCARLCTI
jgi:dTDP-4-dehydrorhamnose reductase